MEARITTYNLHSHFHRLNQMALNDPTGPNAWAFGPNSIFHSFILSNMNVFNLDLNVAVESDSFNEAGNLLRRWGVNWRDVFKHWNDNLKRKFFSFLGEWETSLFFLSLSLFLSHSNMALWLL